MTWAQVALRCGAGCSHLWGQLQSIQTHAHRRDSFGGFYRTWRRVGRLVGRFMGCDMLRCCTTCNGHRSTVTMWYNRQSKCPQRRGSINLGCIAPALFFFFFCTSNGRVLSCEVRIFEQLPTRAMRQQSAELFSPRKASRPAALVHASLGRLSQT